MKTYINKTKPGRIADARVLAANNRRARVLYYGRGTKARRRRVGDSSAAGPRVVHRLPRRVVSTCGVRRVYRPQSSFELKWKGPPRTTGETSSNKLSGLTAAAAATAVAAAVCARAFVPWLI